MLKLNEFIKYSGMWSAVLLLGSSLAGCGGGGAADIVCPPDGDCSQSTSSTTDSLSVADSDGFTFAASQWNPESYNVDGVTVDITVGLNDFQGNPPPDGTVVLFDAEAGTIPAKCAITNGRCTVTWISGNPRPGYGPNPMGKIDGRFIIFARALGAESFTDLNNNNRFDGIGVEPFIDLPEPFFDINENGVYDFGEQFQDSPGGTDGVYDGADGLYNGPRCNADCSPVKSIYVGGSYTFVMSTSDAYIWSSSNSEIQRDYNVIGGTTLPSTTTPTTPIYTYTVAPIDLTTSGGVRTFNDVFVGDRFGNSLASGTTVSISATGVNIVGNTDYTVTDTATAALYTPFTLQTDGSSGTGTLTITITSSPSGQVTTFQWQVTD